MCVHILQPTRRIPFGIPGPIRHRCAIYIGLLCEAPLRKRPQPFSGLTEPLCHLSLTVEISASVPHGTIPLWTIVIFCGHCCRRCFANVVHSVSMTILSNVVLALHNEAIPSRSRGCCQRVFWRGCHVESCVNHTCLMQIPTVFTPKFLSMFTSQAAQVRCQRTSRSVNSSSI